VPTTGRFGSGRRLVALHGFTHTGEQYRSLADEIGREIYAPDLPGHGVSTTESTQIDDVLASITASIASVGDGAPVLGYSQGARLALLLATRTLSVSGPLILMSGTAGIEDPADRRDRMGWDRSTGDEIIEIGIERFIDEWTSSGMTSTEGLPEDIRRSDRDERLANTAEGLASALSGYGTGTMPSMWHVLDTITVPTLILTGSRDTTYTGLGERMATAIGDNASHRVINGAGHDLLLSGPTATAAHIKEFLG
jgi:2-succinyl-6-hydroxy-2,4-cyclohexadiene-1-carboxylate synthase